ncbi:bifunctional precorrin-2 dehydrogenase/sirohydrochlorin ferrochelatase [Mariniphaga sediminis]|jgi:siroheme synthase-like protein|uniref:precorrin-2 dehydrogenase n=1 Tax=Mariniphaga sediminis TaxID=1628158 RepID=A0A399D1E9_9BACT|nr:bifunctional precorrin-2 dehydrogenase/sirohydrochlorin ferrochelatase [Mariniphaga sediminis]RIH65263.1 bifunctional precorrin-2 dehydrogenase/sirohydrochlorin ferrochelatase [Mariniphaga sediminis]
MNKNFLPIAIDISNQKILIVGGDHSAWKKLKILQRFDAKVEILAKNICEEIKQSGVTYYEKTYHKKYLNGYLMLYSCTNNEALDRQIVEDCRQAGVLVNIHDKPALCQFVSPAIYRNGNISVAVSSNGEDVYESIRLRDKIKAYLQ